MLLAIDFHEDFINVKGVTITSLLSFQSSGISGSKLDVPEADGFVTYSDTAFSEQIFDEWSGTPAVAKVESVVEPDRIADDIGREPVALVGIHHRIINYGHLTCQYLPGLSPG